MAHQTFSDRRDQQLATEQPTVEQPVERRQFGNSYQGLSPDARELGEAIDRYKLERRRRFVTYEEILEVMHSLGYSK